MIEILIKYKMAFLSGALTTLKLTGIAWFVGIILGVFLGIVLINSGKILNVIFSLLSFLLSATPILVILYWFHYPLQYMLQIVIDPFITSVFILSSVNTIFVANSLIESKKQIPKQFFEAALVHGVKKIHYILKIELPLLIRSAIPSILFIQVNILHMSLFAGLISVDEMFRTALRINAIEYRPVEVFTILALFFIVLSTPILLVAYILKKKYGRDFSEK